MKRAKQTRRSYRVVGITDRSQLGLGVVDGPYIVYKNVPLENFAAIPPISIELERVYVRKRRHAH